MPNLEQLNFEVKLRKYKNITAFKAYKPWMLPVTKGFSPERQWEVQKGDIN